MDKGPTPARDKKGENMGAGRLDGRIAFVSGGLRGIGRAICACLAADGASVVNVSSIMGLVGMGDVSAYNASKGAVRLFSKSNALEFADAGIPIRVNSIHPGFVETPLLHQGMARWAERDGVSAQDLIDGMAAATPIKRLAQPVEIGKVVAFLASDDASYMTGSEVVVDGGWTAR